jgi:hypothetical protein
MTAPTIAEDAARDATAPRCEQCSQPFNRRRASGGKPQRFCSPECRIAFHSENRQRDQQSPTCSAVTEPVATSLAEPPKATQEAAEVKLAAYLEKHPERDNNFDDSIVLEEQTSIAVYFDKRELVIRQLATWDRDEDTFIYIAPQNIAKFIDKLADLVGIPSVGKK